MCIKTRALNVAFLLTNTIWEVCSFSVSNFALVCFISACFCHTFCLPWHIWGWCQLTTVLLFAMFCLFCLCLSFLDFFLTHSPNLASTDESGCFFVISSCASGFHYLWTLSLWPMLQDTKSPLSVPIPLAFMSKPQILDSLLSMLLFLLHMF